MDYGILEATIREHIIKMGLEDVDGKYSPIKKRKNILLDFICDFVLYCLFLLS